MHFEQEYATYVRDFPVMVGWAYVQCPIAEVRRELAENLYEEETGGLIAGRPHPELFLEYPARPRHGPRALRARRAVAGRRASSARVLDEHTQRRGWAQAARSRRSSSRAPTTSAASSTRTRRSAPRRRSRTHPLVVHYGLPLEALALTKAHRRVEGSHRAAAWRIILDHVPAAGVRGRDRRDGAHARGLARLSRRSRRGLRPHALTVTAQPRSVTG